MAWRTQNQIIFPNNNSNNNNKKKNNSNIIIIIIIVTIIIIIIIIIIIEIKMLIIIISSLRLLRQDLEKMHLFIAILLSPQRGYDKSILFSFHHYVDYAA